MGVMVKENGVIPPAVYFHPIVHFGVSTCSLYQADFSHIHLPHDANCLLHSMSASIGYFSFTGSLLTCSCQSFSYL